MLASGHELYNRLLESEIDVMERLFGTFRFGRHDEPHPDGRMYDEAPIFRRVRSRLAVRYSKYWLDVGARTTHVPLERSAADAVAAVERVLEQPDLVAELTLRPGDALFFANHVVHHGRRSFEDEPNGKGPGRTLLRVWVGPDSP